MLLEQKLLDALHEEAGTIPESVKELLALALSKTGLFVKPHGVEGAEIWWYHLSNTVWRNDQDERTKALHDLMQDWAPLGSKPVVLSECLNLSYKGSHPLGTFFTQYLAKFGCDGRAGFHSFLQHSLDQWVEKTKGDLSEPLSSELKQLYTAYFNTIAKSSNRLSPLERLPVPNLDNNQAVLTVASKDDPTLIVLDGIDERSPSSSFLREHLPSRCLHPFVSSLMKKHNLTKKFNVKEPRKFIFETYYDNEKESVSQ